ncbi:hypothetical protein XCR1_970029 [Xenorhabdus cabanillasii JM26]|uniref:Uncharacterized protein n=1 Tax=Xenorhabdus cabanillasii JM26 TaxID=1427517 RepID=W1JC38_9GAMM|nr:hypothetical protein XCR1_970029 [Xenorhabdus cabanillasii JM26]
MGDFFTGYYIPYHYNHVLDNNRNLTTFAVLLHCQHYRGSL